MKKLLLLSFLFCAISIFAQKTITGTVTDSDGQPVPSASVTVENPANNVIIAFGITNTKGVYKIPFNTELSKVRLKVKAFNQKAQTKTVNNADQTANFKLESEFTEIKEVVLKAKMITKRGDTISYDLRAFANKNDRVLADALKKVPGIDVNKDGTILYQGDPINKFYVNGKDLMEGGYGTINNALPLDAIAKVEVMENHQPVKILQDKVPSEQAAINVKLKNSVTMTGRGEVGLGASPFLWNVKLTPMLFANKTQWLINYKTNNNGDAVENEGNILAFGSRYEGFRRNTSQTSWLNVERAATPNVPQSRYLRNQVHLLSANLLTNMGEKSDWEFKASAAYSNNSVKRESFEETDYLPPFNDGAVITNTINNKLHTDKLSSEINFTKNAKKGFFKNTTSFTKYWNQDRAAAEQNINGVQNTMKSANEFLDSPTYNIQNSLSTIIPWKEKLLNLRSLISYQDDRQDLLVDPANYSQQEVEDDNDPNVKNPLFGPLAKYANQVFRMKTFETEEALNVSFSAGKWTFTPEVGVNYRSNKMSSALFGRDDQGISEDLGERFKNDVTFDQLRPYTSGQINYKGTHLTMYVNVPVNFNRIRATDPMAERHVNVKLDKVTVQPNAFLQYEFASFWKASANGSMNTSFGTISDVYSGYILQSPLFLNRPYSNDILAQNKSRSGGLRLEYRNPLNNLFFNIRGNASKNTRNLMINNILEDGLNRVDVLPMNNNSTSQSESAEVGKYFPSFKTNMSVSFSNSDSKSLAMTNSLLQHIRNNNKSFSFKFNNAFFSWMSLDYTMNTGWGESKYTMQNDVTQTENTNFSHNLSLIFYPIKNHSIGLNWDQDNYKQGNQNFHNPFYDLTYQFTWEKKKMDFEVKWLNIANTRVYETIGNTERGTTYRRMFIRPSQVMFTVKFNFK